MVQTTSGHTIEHYKLIRQLGDGQFGVGYLAQDTNQNMKCCVKIFKDMDESTEKTFKAEVMAGQSGLAHPNIIRLLGAGRSQINKNGKASSKDSFYIVSELCPNGEAFDFVQDAGGLKDDYARTLFSQLCSAVKFVHDKGIAHRDLKLENCFLDKNINMKLADFGLAKVFAGPNGSALQTECGTPQYMAPEISSGSYDGPPVDIFALGVILFIMCNAKFPFGKAGDKYYNKYHKSPEEAMAARNISCNSDLLDLIRGMTLADPSQRLNINQVAQHSWMQGQRASQEDIFGLHADLNQKAVEIQKANSSSRSSHRSAAGKSGGAHRGLPEEWGVDVNEWASLTMTKHTPDLESSAKHCFYANHAPTFVAESIFKFCKKQDEESDIEMHDLKWKLKFTIKGDEEEMLEDANVEVTFQESKEASSGTIPDEVFVQFSRTKGNALTYTNFMKEMMAEDGGVNIWVKDE